MCSGAEGGVYPPLVGGGGEAACVFFFKKNNWLKQLFQNIDQLTGC